MGERAIRHLAVQRKISGSFFKRVAPHYLRLLAINQTCRFQEKSFLRFLLSAKKDVDQFKDRRAQESLPERSHHVRMTSFDPDAPRGAVFPENPYVFRHIHQTTNCDGRARPRLPYVF